MSDQENFRPDLKTDFFAKQAHSFHAPISKQPPVMIALSLLGAGVLFGAVQLITYVFNYDKISAMKNVDIQFKQPVERDGNAYVTAEISNYNPESIENTAFSYQISDGTGKVLKQGKVTIPTIISAGESRTFPEISLGQMQAGHMQVQLGDLKCGPKTSLSNEQRIKFINAAELGPKESLNAFVDFVKTAPEYAPGYVRLGEALEANNDLDNAIKAFQKALRLDPDDASAHYNLGVAYYYKKDNRSAKDEFEAAAKLVPDDPAVMASLKQVGGAKDN